MACQERAGEKIEWVCVPQRKLQDGDSNQLNLDFITDLVFTGPKFISVSTDSTSFFVVKT